MIPQRHAWQIGAWALLSCVFLAAKDPSLADRLLAGDSATRLDAVHEFNRLPRDAKYKMVPDFMVALSDENPDIRQRAGKILQAMGVSMDPKSPDAKRSLSSEKTESRTAERKKALKEVEHAKGEAFPDLKKELEAEKQNSGFLDASLLKSDQEITRTPSIILDSLKDPDPWVRSQSARRLSTIRPAPVEAIPTLIGMLSDKETESRRAAVAALGSFGHLAREAILPLNAALSDPDPDVRTLAADALKQIQQVP